MKGTQILEKSNHNACLYQLTRQGNEMLSGEVFHKKHGLQKIMLKPEVSFLQNDRVSGLYSLPWPFTMLPM